MSENTTIDYRPAIEKYVKDYFYKYLESVMINLNEDEFNHIISIGTSVIETKWPEIGPGYSGGSFVQAVVDNDLMGAIGRADHINITFLKFYCQLIYNFNPYQIGYRE